MKFFVSVKNHIVAVVSEEHAALFAQASRENIPHRGHQFYEDEAIRLGARVFTFCDPKRYEQKQFTDRYAKLLYTGTLQDLERLIEQGGHSMVDNPQNSGWSGYVPNADRGELVGDSPDTLERDLVYAVNLTDVRQVFGVKFAKSDPPFAR